MPLNSQVRALILFVSLNRVVRACRSRIILFALQVPIDGVICDAGTYSILENL